MTEESHNPSLEGDEVPSEKAAQAAKLLAAEAAEARAKLAKERAEAALTRSEATRDLDPKADASAPKAPVDSSPEIPAAPSKPVLRTVQPTPAPVAPAAPAAPQAPKPAVSQTTATASPAKAAAVRPKVQPDPSLATEDSSVVSMPALVIDAIAAALAIAFTVLIIQDALPFLQ